MGDEHEQRAAAALRAVPDAVVAIDRTGVVVSWNPAAERLLGVPERDAVGHSLERLGVLPHIPPAGTRTETTARRPGRSTFRAEVTAVETDDARTIFVRDLSRRATPVRRREQQQRFLAEASAVLHSGLDTDATLRRLARLAVPELADWCMVYLVDEEARVRRVSIETADAGDAAFETAADEVHPDIDPESDAGVAGVIRTGRPLLEPVTTPEAMAADTTDPGRQAQLIRRLGLRSWICVPLTARGTTFGALSLVTAGSGRTYDAGHLAFAEQLAHRAAIALDNARQYGHTHALAEELQRSLLPESLPSPPGVSLAARYLPGSPGARVGGDWYDALQRDAGDVALVIGDVAGRGVRAAAIMGQLRTALRAYLVEGHAPEVAMSRLSHFVEGLGTPDMATAACLVVDPETGAIRLSGAGHPPALVIDRHGETRFLRSPIAAPLGVSGVCYSGSEHVVDPGGMVVLYTDGLVERRAEPLTEGLARLEEAARGWDGPPEGLCVHLIAELVAGDARPDDVAVIALRRDAG